MMGVFRIARLVVCILLVLFGLVLLHFMIFYQPDETNYYLPKNVVIGIKAAEANAHEAFRNRLRHAAPQRIVRQPVKHVYPKRQNMQECKPLFGTVGIFVAVNSDHDKRLYKIAQASLKCYLKSTSYKYFHINVDTDERTEGKCNQTIFYYKRHCVAAHYLEEVDWMLFLDGDIGVVNPNHCIEEWIDDRVDMLFYERFFNWEIMSGSYLFKNTEQSRKFLMELGNAESEEFRGFTGYDNGALQLKILKAALPGALAEIKACDRIYKRSTSEEKYYNYVTCVKLQLGAVRVFPGTLRIYRRAHGWARDSSPTSNDWSDNDFMIHAWKASKLNTNWFDANVFERIPDPNKCGRDLTGWLWRPEKHVSVESIRQQLSSYEKSNAKNYPKEGRGLPHLIESDIGECFPSCDKFT